MSDNPGGDGAEPGSGEPEVPIPRAVTTSAGTVSYARPTTSFTSGYGGPTNGAARGPRMTPAQQRRAKRLAYWNRQKPPKDWRYWVGGTGRVLITLGLLMFAFVAYQLWGTGIEEARAQNKLENELEQRRAELGTVPVTVPASTIAPDTTAPPATAPGETVPAETTPPVTEVPTTAPALLSLPPIAEGEAIGDLRIPKIDVDKSVVAGVSVPDLKKGPGHFPQTPMPGELGNAAIAGHRTTYGGPFLHLNELEEGDEIVWVNIYGQEFVYHVTSTEIVKPSQGEVINTDDPTKATLVLITCDPVRTSKNRLVVHAELVEERSPAPTAGQPYYGQEGSAITELPGEDVPEETTAGTAVAGTTPAATTTPAVATDGADSPTGFSDTDPFAQGWFGDSAAWPQVAAWGFGLILVVAACYALARALKRRWVGWIVAVAPFTFLLYFFFQNVNRLLPPGL